MEGFFIMSHGECYFKDGLILHFEYNGTSDLAGPKLRSNKEEVTKHWRSYDNWAHCSCRRSEPVILYTDYASGFHWSGRACRYCHAITVGIEPIDQECTLINGKPTQEELQEL